ncbi:MAG: NUDIX hydrolase [Rhodospirillales bacterium]|nr:NUDIX hydrolase [Rhodospirillales bacterium]
MNEMGREKSFSQKIPEGDDRPRRVCDSCGFIDYENPRIIVGAVCTLDDRFLLCRRAIPPRQGYWTMPAGYLEMGETTEQGAIRESWEEARARIVLDDLLALYNVPRIGQVHMIYRARLTEPGHAPGPESLETALLRWDDVPWNDLAYPNVGWALRHWKVVEGKAGFTPFGVPADYTGPL